MQSTVLCLIFLVSLSLALSLSMSISFCVGDWRPDGGGKQEPDRGRHQHEQRVQPISRCLHPHHHLYSHGESSRFHTVLTLTITFTLTVSPASPSLSSHNHRIHFHGESNGFHAAFTLISHWLARWVQPLLRWHHPPNHSNYHNESSPSDAEFTLIIPLTFSMNADTLILFIHVIIFTLTVSPEPLVSSSSTTHTLWGTW